MKAPNFSQGALGSIYRLGKEVLFSLNEKKLIINTLLNQPPHAVKRPPTFY